MGFAQFEWAIYTIGSTVGFFLFIIVKLVGRRGQEVRIVGMTWDFISSVAHLELSTLTSLNIYGALDVVQQLVSILQLTRLVDVIVVYEWLAR